MKGDKRRCPEEVKYNGAMKLIIRYYQKKYKIDL
jgi:hypothetical protein